MKVPQIKKRFCKYCKKNTEHKVSINKQGKPSSLSRGAKLRMAKRGRGDVGYGNKGKISRGAISSWKMSGAKTSKKILLKLKCKICGKFQIMVMGRAKKMEIKQG